MFYHHDQYAILSPFTQSELLLPKAHYLLLVAIAFSSTILLNPSPHIEPALHTCNKLSSSETAKNEPDQAGQGTLLNHTS